MTAAAARRFLPSDPKDFLRSAVPLVLLGLAAWEPSARWMMLVLLVLGTVVATRRNAPVRWTWAAAVPAAAAFAVDELDLFFASAFPAFCDTPGNGPVSGALGAAVVVVGATVALAVPLGADRATLFARMPRRMHLPWIPLGLGAGLVVGFLLAPVLVGRPPTSLLTVQLDRGSVTQAVLFGLGTAVAAELSYRGALLGWSSRILGVGPSVLGQAIIVALAAQILGGDVIPALAVGAYALLIGIVTAQIRSLAVGLATTTGLWAGLYLQLWCSG